MTVLAAFFVFWVAILGAGDKDAHNRHVCTPLMSHYTCNVIAHGGK